jgi:hypothetical protein
MSQREKIAIGPSDRSSRFTARPVETLAGNRTLTLAEVEQWQAIALDAVAAARDVLLPAVGACAGTFLYVANASSGAGTLAIKDAGGTLVPGVTTVAQNKSAFVWCDGVRWYAQVGA